MSTATHDHGHDHGHDHAHEHKPTGAMRWIGSTNHKDIGTMYLWFSFTMFLVGGVMALIIRAELFQPGLQIVKPEFFNSMTTYHGLIMVFGAIMPAFVGFANWLIWSHGGYGIDEDGKVAINSKETLAALNYLKELYPTFVSGTLSWNDVSNNRAFAANELFLTANGVSLYFALKNDPATKAIADDTDHAPLMSGDGITDKEFAQIAQAHGGGWDIDLIAGSYREQMGERLAKLSGAKLMKSWTGFCQAFAARRGRP